MSEYSTQKILELACAAYRTYGEYIKDADYRYDSNGKFLFVKHSNKDLVKNSLGLFQFENVAQEYRPFNLILTPEDAVEAEEIRKYFRRLIFSALAGSNEFETEVNALLDCETVSKNKIGYIVCLPSVYRRSKERNTLEKTLRNCDDEPLGLEGTTVFDKDCEVLKVNRSRNFNAWNILAVIDNKIVSWMSKNEIHVGPAVVQKLKIKSISENYQTKKIETRLNYVKVVQ